MNVHHMEGVAVDGADRAEGVYSIGVVARMLGVPPQTLRAWEDRYHQVVPARSDGGQRLFSRDQVDQLMFVRDQTRQGLRPGDAHRLLAHWRSERPAPPNVEPSRRVPGSSTAAIPREPDTREFAELVKALQDVSTPAATADEIVEYVRRQLDATYVGLTLIRSGNRLETVAATDALVAEADRLEHELDEGPRHDDAWHEGKLLSSEIPWERRWPRWSDAVSGLGIVSVLAVELINLDDRRIGSINVYWTRRREFTAEDVEFANIVARYSALALVQSMADATLNTTLDTRVLLSQAQGILMERYQLDEAKAFEVLRRYSQDHDVTLRRAAQHLIATPPNRLVTEIRQGLHQ